MAMYSNAQAAAPNRAREPARDTESRAERSDAIDVVYTWVDGQDPQWQRSYGSYVGGAHSNPLAAETASRYFERDQLRYSLRSLEMYAPFVRHVYLVTANQVPAWLDVDHPGLTVVPHSDIFPNAAHLPTFNSHSIETHLHRIKGLSERFLYVNDDVCFSRKTSVEDFFDEAGRPILYFDKRRVLWTRFAPGYRGLVHCAARNNSRFLEDRFGFRITHRVDHVPYALRKSTMEELWRLLPDELERTSSNRTRDPSDHALPSSLAPFYGLCTGAYVAERRRQSTYIKLKGGLLNQLRAHVSLYKNTVWASTQRKFISVNDSGRFDDSAITARLVQRLLETHFPHACRFERPPVARTALAGSTQ